MLEKRFNAQDLRRLARYNQILTLCKKQSTVFDLEEAMPCTNQMLRLDCVHLAEKGYLTIDKKQAGQFNQFTNHYKSLKFKYDASQLEPIHLRKRNLKAIRDAAVKVPKEVTPAHIRIIPERMVMSVRPSLGKHHISGSSMSGSTW